MDFIQPLQQKIDELAEERYEDDIHHPPEFIVSIEYISKMEQRILVTVKHGNIANTRCLFPNEDNKFGALDLVDFIDKLYGTTM